jgi:hypothetical protein
MCWITFAIGLVAGVGLSGFGVLVGMLLQHRAEQQFWNEKDEE